MSWSCFETKKVKGTVFFFQEGFKPEPIYHSKDKPIAALKKKAKRSCGFRLLKQEMFQVGKLLILL